MNYYLTQEMSERVILRLKEFHKNLNELYIQYDINICDDICRRNALMSHAQEKFFAEELRSIYPTAHSDGRTGHADIEIPEISQEIECKITTRRKKGGFSLQADYASLKRKGELDFLYVLTDSEFNKFAVLHFSSLTVEDFFKPSPGSRGKSKMNKTLGMKKCKVLLGTITTRNEIELEKLAEKIKSTSKKKVERINEIDQKISTLGVRAHKRRQFLHGLLKKERARFDKKISTFSKREKYWKTASKKFSIGLFDSNGLDHF